VKLLSFHAWNIKKSELVLPLSMSEVTVGVGAVEVVEVVDVVAVVPVELEFLLAGNPH
jgi:hypothetical protein